MNSFKKQIQSLWHNKFLGIICFVLPLFLGFLVYSIFYMELPKKLPIGIVDQDKSTLSAEIKFSLNATSTLNIVRVYNSLRGAKSDLSSGKIYALVVIPEGLERNTKIDVKTKIPFYYNAQFVLIGKSIDSAFLQVIATINAKMNVAKGLAKKSNLNSAKSLAMPIVSKIHALYNPNNSYAQFLLTLILPCMWQILAALGMLNLLEKASGIKDVIAGFVINVVIFSLWGIGMLKSFQALGYALNGDYNILFLGILMMTGGISGMVICFQSILRDCTKTVSVIAAYTAPSLAFAGITYPQSSMDGFALFWSHILPISYFMKLYLQQANYGLDAAYSLKIIVQMLPFLLFFPLGLLIYRLRAGK
ncbi:ABC transporter permease [Helicobacter sp. 12S02232-10]|uniref:ABC transporter permease n=1 Tax=Helicobacter sp. 12S02232-10 TaxID=1476197 RepID=UPI000BA7CF42|nr:ABC transporter permease [Helicobacter sp. 12S02232-10]PAF48931.1 ABC transporter permease [Helicobacter sp. 12S02232-10]